MKKIKFFFSFITIVIIIFFIFIYIFLKNLNEEKVIGGLEKKYNLNISQVNESQISIFPNIKYNTSLKITNFHSQFNVDQIDIAISQPIFSTQGNLHIFLDNISLTNLKFSNLEIKGNINYFQNYITNQNNFENLFDGIYEINGSFELLTTNEDRFIISFLKLFFENLEDKENQQYAFSKLIDAFGNDSSNFTGDLKKNNYLLTSNNILLSNKENEIYIKGEYNYNKNLVNIILDLSQNKEIYLTTFVKGDVNNPNISFDKNSKFFQNIDSDKNNIIEDNVIKLLNNFLNIDD